MTKKVAYLITVCLLMPALVAASNPLTIIPTELLVPTVTSLNVERVRDWAVAELVDLFVYGNQAYIAHHINRWDPETDAILSILDISDPAHPTETDLIEGPYGGSYQAVHADSSYIYTAEDYPHAAGPRSVPISTQIQITMSDGTNSTTILELSRCGPNLDTG